MNSQVLFNIFVSEAKKLNVTLDKHTDTDTDTIRLLIENTFLRYNDAYRAYLGVINEKVFKEFVILLIDFVLRK